MFLIPYGGALIGLPVLGMPFLVAPHALLPRLLGTVTVGFLFLISSSEIASLLAKRSHELALLASLATLASSILGMSRRLFTTRLTPHFLLRWLLILMIGVAHAITLVALGQSAVRWALPAKLREALGPTQVVEAALVILGIGWILNVIWAEEPVTDPL
jgi:hypothetical protein